MTVWNEIFLDCWVCCFVSGMNSILNCHSLRYQRNAEPCSTNELFIALASSLPFVH